MQEIITEILERHDFPTKNVEELVASVERQNFEELIKLTVITVGDQETGEIVGYLKGFTFTSIKDPFPSMDHWNYCRLGSELVARLKGGE
jgi:hypothetical protein